MVLQYLKEWHMEVSPKEWLMDVQCLNNHMECHHKDNMEFNHQFMVNQVNLNLINLDIPLNSMVVNQTINNMECLHSNTMVDNLECLLNNMVNLECLHNNMVNLECLPNMECPHNNPLVDSQECLHNNSNQEYHLNNMANLVCFHNNMVNLECLHNNNSLVCLHNNNNLACLHNNNNLECLNMEDNLICLHLNSSSKFKVFLLQNLDHKECKLMPLVNYGAVLLIHSGVDCQEK